jgi:hypothetical protein
VGSRISAAASYLLTVSAQVDNAGNTVAELDVDQVASDVMRFFDGNHGQAKRSISWTA